MLVTSEGGQFMVVASIPIGLSATDQAPRHTNLVGVLIRGRIACGELVSVEMRGGASRKAQLIGITVPPSLGDVGDRSFRAQVSSVELDGTRIALSVRIPPQLAHEIMIDEIELDRTPE